MTTVLCHRKDRELKNCTARCSTKKSSSMPGGSSGGNCGSGANREGLYGNSVLSAQCFCEPRTALKTKVCYERQRVLLSHGSRGWGAEGHLSRRSSRDLEGYTQDRELEMKMFPSLSLSGHYH